MLLLVSIFYASVPLFFLVLRFFGGWRKKLLLTRIFTKFLPKEINPEKSEQRYLMKTLDIHDLIDQAAGIFNFDWKQTKNQVRPTGQDKILRDMLMQLLWEQGAFKNEEIGNAMDISYSGVSKSVSRSRNKFKKTTD